MEPRPTWFCSTRVWWTPRQPSTIRSNTRWASTTSASTASWSSTTGATPERCPAAPCAAGSHLTLPQPDSVGVRTNRAGVKPPKPTGNSFGSGPFQSPPTSAHGELVEPSATVLRQAQDERVFNFYNFEKARAIAYEITATSLRRKPESRVFNLLDFRREATGIGHWIPAFAGMTVVKQSICDCPVGPGSFGFPGFVIASAAWQSRRRSNGDLPTCVQPQRDCHVATLLAMTTERPCLWAGLRLPYQCA